ncbi:MAG: tetratricopeptide repeat protein [Flavisolibacter sp.]
MAKTSLLIAITLLLHLPVACQQGGKRIPLTKKTQDTATIHSLLAQGEAVEVNLPDSALHCYEKATSLAFEIKDVRLLTTCMSQQMTLLNNKASFEEALHLALQHIEMASQINNASLKMKAFNEAANEYEYQGNYEPATEYYLKALQYAARLGDKKMQRMLNNNLGSVFLALKDYTTGYSYSSRACELSKEAGDSVTMSNCLVNMGVAELYQKKYPQALQHLDEAEQVGYRIPDMTLVADALSDKGLVYLARHDLKEAAASYQKQKLIADKYNLPYEKMYSLFQLAMVEKERGHFQNANNYASHAIAIGERQGTADELMEMYDSMSVIKQRIGDLKSALYFKNKYVVLDDSLRNQKVETNIHQLNIQYRTAQKDKKIAEQNLSLEKVKTAIERKNMWIFISLTGITALAVILFLSLRSYRNKQKLYGQQLLTLQKEHEVATLTAKMQAREEERDRIAREMHDDVGSALTTIIYLTEDLKVENMETAIGSADKIASTASSVVEKMNEIIWSMNPDHDTLNDLIAYTRRHCAEFLRDHELPYELDIPETIADLPLSGEQRRNIYLVIKEALHNIVKHAHATKVRITFRQNGQTLNVVICDNGQGLGKASPFGNGIKNMQRRVENIGGDFKIESGTGTTVNLNCPLFRTPA